MIVIAKNSISVSFLCMTTLTDNGRSFGFEIQMSTWHTNTNSGEKSQQKWTF